MMTQPTRYSPARLGAFVGLVTLVLDQLSKLVLLHWVDIENTQPIVVNEVFDLVLVWNRGVCAGVLLSLSRVRLLVVCGWGGEGGR